MDNGEKCGHCGDCCRQFNIMFPMNSKRVPTGMLMFWNLHENIYTRAVEDDKGEKFIDMQIREKCIALMEHADGTSTCKLYWMCPPICNNQVKAQLKDIPKCQLFDPVFSNDGFKELVPQLLRATPAKKSDKSIEESKVINRPMEYKRKDNKKCNRCGDCCYIFAINVPVKNNIIPTGLVYFWNLHEGVHAQVYQNQKGEKHITVQIRQKCGVMARHTDGVTSCKLYWMRPPICVNWPVNLKARQSSDLPQCSLFLPPLTDKQIEKLMEKNKIKAKVVDKVPA